MTATVQGTFVAPIQASATPAFVSQPLIVPLRPGGTGSAKLTTVGLDASNTIKTQKRSIPGGAFADQVTYNADQTATAITVLDNEEWQLVCVSIQANKNLAYKFTIEN